LFSFLISINNILTNSANQDIQKSLDSGNKLFRYINEENSQRLTKTASILASDFAFRKAISTNDKNTVESALTNYRIRFQANEMFLVGLDDKLIANTIQLIQAKNQFPFPELIKSAEVNGDATSIVFMNNHLYQLVVVPVLAPTPIAWLVSAFVIDDKYARNLKSLTNLEVSFLTHEHSNNNWNIRATTLNSEIARSLPKVLFEIDTSKESKAVPLQLDEMYYLANILLLNNQQKEISAVAIIQKSINESLLPLKVLQKTLIILATISFLVAVVISLWIARSITTPIRKLGLLAIKIKDGDYPQFDDLRPSDEIGQLTSAFNHMSLAIQEREARITKLANSDSLTGLPNRTLFLDRLERAIKSIERGGPQVTVMIMDLDRFKEVNDILGHHVGDLLLNEVARRLSSVMSRSSDTIARFEANTIARLGGDEFAMILVATDSKGAQIVARKIQKALDQSILLEGQEIIINASIGISTYLEHGDDVNSLLRHADLAMYAAKRNKLAYSLYDPSIEEQTQEHLSLMAELRNAISNEELKIWYQPKLELSTSNVNHFEALIRWSHPLRGLVSPDEFIPFAEHTGFIVIITQYVIEQVCKKLQEWQKSGVIVNVSINVSARDLLITKLPSIMSKLMKTYEIMPNFITLEITESSIMTNIQGALNIMEELCEMGLSLSVDDFGTGYSSLSYLKKLPISELKIDKSFIQNLKDGSDDETIVNSIINLAHNMGLKIVAEGVENQNTADLLNIMGCDFLQGYLINRPMPADEVPKWLMSFQPKDNEMAINVI
jgi:diguanylate cyclase (GGDEF)-like protein